MEIRKALSKLEKGEDASPEVDLVRRWEETTKKFRMNGDNKLAEILFLDGRIKIGCRGKSGSS